MQLRHLNSGGDTLFNLNDAAARVLAEELVARVRRAGGVLLRANPDNDEPVEKLSDLSELREGEEALLLPQRIGG